MVTSTIGFLAEVLGTNSGFPFGKYYYTDFLGEKAFGVPVVVPLVWFVIAYVAFSIARSAFGGGIKGKVNSNSLVFQLAVLSAFGAVAWDFMIDPMFSSYGYWVWTGQFLQLPELDGIPLTNFVGWFVLVALMVYVCSKIILTRSSGKIIYRKNTIDSEIAYALLVLDGVVANYSLGNYLVIGIGLVAMLAFLVVSHAGVRNRVAVNPPVRVAS
ncbi:MAG: carotenoid biosynthesis protein [Nitrososphaerales archaeon]